MGAAAARQRRNAAVLLLTLGVLALMILVSIAVGSRSMSLRSVWDALWHYDPTIDDHLIVRRLRLPRTFVAALVGAALGVAGAIMQSLTRNLLAEPGILGVNAGASAAVAVGIAAGFTTMWSYTWFAFAGAMVAGAVVYVLGGARRGGADPVRLTLAGAAFSIVLGSFTQLLILNYPATYQEFRFWAVGSFQGRGYGVLVPLTVFVGAGLVIAMALAPSLNAVALGTETGRSLGAAIGRTWSIAAVAVILLAGAATAGAGPIVFIGLTAPHAARAIAGPDHRWSIPYSAVLAAIIALTADVIGRVVVRPGELGAGVVAGIIGGPVFIAFVRRRKVATL